MWPMPRCPIPFRSTYAGVVVALLCVSKLKLCSLLLNEAHFCICMCIFAMRRVCVYMHMHMGIVNRFHWSSHIIILKC